MKKFNSLVLLLAFVGLATSCSQDDSVDLQNSENNRVVINANLEGEAFLKSGPQTRASGDLQVTGYSLRYILEVWGDTSGEVAHREEKLVTDASQTVTFDFSLPDAGDYKALLWADYIPASATATGGHYPDLYYTTDASGGLKAISIIGSAYAVNTASRDAFFGNISFTKDYVAYDAGSVTMRRPFGRINIIEKNETTQAKLESMSLTYSVPSGFNVSNGMKSGSYSVSLIGITSFPTVAADGANLFYDYIFTQPSEQELLSQIEIGYMLTSSVGTYIIPSNIPVVRNKRTNASGNILEDPNSTTLSVEILDAWTADEEKDLDE